MGYDELLLDPRAALEPLAQWLSVEGRVPLSVDDAAISEAARTVTGALSRHDGQGELPEVLRRAVDSLTKLTGPIDTMPPVPMAEPPLWMDDVIAQRRDYEDLYARYMRYVRWRRRIPFIGGPARSRQAGGAR
jgi:hypothetical protein